MTEGSQSGGFQYHPTQAVRTENLDYVVENALWVATANAEDGYLWKRTFTDCFVAQAERHWKELLKLERGRVAEEEQSQEEEPTEQATLVADGGVERSQIRCLGCGNVADELKEHRRHMARASHVDQGETYIR